MQHTDFQLASGSVIGRDHRNVIAPRNGQDGFHVVRSTECTVAVVTDGCGSSAHSEVGAKIGARLITEAVRRETEYRGTGRINWQRVLANVLASLDVLLVQMGGDFRRNAEDLFLFTVVGVLLTGEEATFFALGDGVIVINGETTVLGPFPNNQPPYAGYGLQGMEGLELKIVASLPLADLENFLIGCDGIGELIEAADKNLPGMTEQVGDISQFWQPHYLDPGKPDFLSRRLRMIARDWPRREPEPGLLPDDTTMVVGRQTRPEDVQA